jgi:hypothetical protein
MTRKMFSTASDSGNFNQPMTIRRPDLGEAFNLTGKGILRQCVHIQERFGTSHLTTDRYLAVSPSVAGVASTWGSPVLFYEAISQCGDRFAFPQILDEEYPLQDPRTECEHDALGERPGHWITLDRCEDCDEFHYNKAFFDENERLHVEGFETALDSSLLADTIDCDDHPVILLLQGALSDLLLDSTDEQLEAQ